MKAHSVLAAAAGNGTRPEDGTLESLLQFYSDDHDGTKQNQENTKCCTAHT